MKKKLGFKIVLLLFIAGLISIFFIFNLDDYFSLANLKNELDAFKEYYGQHKVMTMAICPFLEPQL